MALPRSAAAPSIAENISQSIDQLGLPSPADDQLLITTPGFDPSRRDVVEGTQNPWDLPSLTAPLPEPDVANLSALATSSVMTPTDEMVAPTTNLDSFIGMPIDPAPTTDISLPKPLSKPGRDLRLPSFNLLGIANPQPLLLQEQINDQVATFSPSLPGCGSFNLAGLPDPFADNTPSSIENSDADPLSRRASLKAHAKRPNLHQFATPITPPQDTPGTQWRLIAAATGDHQSESQDPAAPPPTRPTLNPRQPAAQAAVSQQPRIEVHRSESDMARGSFLDEACNAIMNGLHLEQLANTPVKVLSHALPCPSTTGYAFPVIINSLHNHTPGTPTYWINVFHAVPGRYNLSDIPTSPPGTPGQAVGGDDYFTSKVFDNAVRVLDYQDKLEALPQSPRPVVPPATVNVSIVERYIPPTNANEFSEMFKADGRSLLRDRLIELSPDNGTLLFIYPTRRGAQTFMREYLGPILDPLLRSMCVINGLSVDLGSSLGKMDAVEKMFTFDSLKSNIEQLCHNLSRGSDRLQRTTKTKSKFTISYASKEEVFLERKTWAENWWIKQEKPRVREILSRYFRAARRLPEDSDVTPTSLIHEVLDGVASRPYGNAPEPLNGVEVGMFVITRTHAE